MGDRRFPPLQRRDYYPDDRRDYPGDRRDYPGDRRDSPAERRSSGPPEQRLDKYHPPPAESEPRERNLIIDVIGSQREVTIIGHLSIVRHMPFRMQSTRHLLEQYYREPGDYDGRPSPYSDATARLNNYGGDYVGLTLYEDISRPELSEFLQDKGWKMIGYTASTGSDNRVFLAEKWTNVKD